MTTFYWSKTKGKFVNKLTGIEIKGCSFTGIKREWYECFWECINDLASKSESDKFVIKASPDVCMMLESSCMFKEDFDYDYNTQSGRRGFVSLMNRKFSLNEFESFSDDVIKVCDMHGDVEIGEVKILP